MASWLDATYPTPPQPRQLRLDTTTRCNASCLSCHRFLSDRKGEMDFSLLHEILTDVSKWTHPLEEIVPVNYGEFFMREDWYSILASIIQCLPKTPIVIPTNGALLKGNTVLQLCGIPNIKVVNFSVNAFFDESYKAFTGLPSETLETIHKAIAQFKILRPDILIRTSMVFDPMYHSDLERDLFINHYRTISDPWVLSASSAGRDKKPQIIHKIPCRSIFSDIVIGFDKKITSCCWDSNFSLSLGMYEGNLLENWNGKELIELRRLHNEHRRDEIGFCRSCTSA